MGGKKSLRRPLWPPTRATASNYYPLGLDGAGGAAKPLLRAPKKPAPLHGRLPAFSGAVDAFERARKCFLEWRYFFSIILSEFLKNRVALQQVLPLVFVIVVQKSGKTARRKAGLGSGFFGGLPAVCAQPGGRQMGVRRRHGSLTELCCHGGEISHGRSRKKAWSCLPPIAFLPPPHYNSQYNQSSAPKSAFASLRRSGQREGRASRPDLNL